MSSSIADRFLQARGSMKQMEFAQMLGINPNTLRNYENGRVLPNQKVLERLCTIFSISPVWLLMGKGSMYQEDIPMPEQKPHPPSPSAVTAPPLCSAQEYPQQHDCQGCAFLRVELQYEREERRSLANENRNLYKRCMEQERLIGELRLALARSHREEADKRSSPISDEALSLPLERHATTKKGESPVMLDASGFVPDVPLTNRHNSQAIPQHEI